MLDIDALQPVKVVTVDLVADGLPAWYYLTGDQRGEKPLQVGPLVNRTGRYRMMVFAMDSNGCENTLTSYATLRP